MRRQHLALIIELPSGAFLQHPLDVVEERTVDQWMRLAWKGEIPAGAVARVEVVE